MDKVSIWDFADFTDAYGVEKSYFRVTQRCKLGVFQRSSFKHFFNSVGDISGVLKSIF